MRKRWISLLLVVAMCCTGVALSMAEDEDDQEVSIAEYFAAQNGEVPEGEDLDGDGVPDETPAPVDKTLPVYELDGSTLLTMTFTGDFTIGDNLQSSGRSMFQKELDKQKGDINFPFRNMRDILLADDLTVINFEGTLTTAGKNKKKLENSFLFRAPPEYVTILPDNGVDAVSFENNHALDMGEEGAEETKKTLMAAGIPYASEDEPAIITVKGVKVGLLAYQTFNGRYEDLPQKVPQDIADLRQQGVDIVIVNYHWGDEEDYWPNDNQVKLAHATIDGGADLIIGHHSHRHNPIEYYNGKYICYSLGNFAFAGNTKPKDMSTFIFQIRMRVKDGVVTSDAIKIIPARISSRTDYNDFAPTPYTKQQNVESLLSVLKKNGARLEFAVEDYPLKWPGEE